MGKIVEVVVPDIGDFSDVEIVDVAVAPHAVIDAEDTLISLESDKSTLDIPAPHAGTVKEIKVAIGDRVSQGDLIVTMEVNEEDEAPAADVKPASTPTAPQEDVRSEHKPAPVVESPYKPVPVTPAPADATQSKPHASPSVRKFARELGVDLIRVLGSGAKGRITQEDVQGFVKGVMHEGPAQRPVAGGFALPEVPVIDFGKFGEIETQSLSRIQKLSGTHLHRAWLTIPHVTQFDEADITELEAFRKSLKGEAERKGVKVTFLAFLIKASVTALQTFPHFNASLDPSGENLIYKKYFNIGFACDTPEGLVVPVIRDVDQKGVYDLARELMSLSVKAREKKLSPGEMQGGNFTISSLGGIGGTQFTPIVNVPEVAILGVSRSAMKPVYQDGQFVPRLMLPLSLSYDHRVIDGADGARFTTFLCQVLADMRRVLL